MKLSRIILGGFLACSIVGFSSDELDKVPQKVKDAFVKKFPTIKKIKWEKENDTEWEAEFKMNEMEYSVNFLIDGTWTETEHEIGVNDIPAVIKEAIDTSFTEYEIEEVAIIETNLGVVYELEIEKDENNLKVVLNMDGTIVKQEEGND